MSRAVHIPTDERPRTVVIVNPYCNAGRGWRKWLSIREEALRYLNPATELTLDTGSSFEELLTLYPSKTVVSAGGDGSIHYLVNYLLHSGNMSNVSIGAIGIGSSNDFLKPFSRKIGSIPVRINLEKAPATYDVGRIHFSGPGTDGMKYFIVNASFGVTAEANWNFNYPGRLLRLLKKTNTGAAIMYTAIKSILKHRNRSLVLEYNGTWCTRPVSNINVLKVPFVSGSLHYSQQLMPDDGKLGLNLCLDMNKRELLSTLRGLEKGKFTENEKRISVYTDHLVLHSEQPVIFECDGETGSASHFTVTILKKAISVLSS